MAMAYVQTTQPQPLLGCEPTIPIPELRCHTCDLPDSGPMFRIAIGRLPGWSMRPVLCLECISRLTLALSACVRDLTLPRGDDG